MYLIATLILFGPALVVSGLWAAGIIGWQWFIFAGLWIVAFSTWAVTETAADKERKNSK